MPKFRPLYVLGVGLILSLAVAGCSGDSDSSSSAAAAAAGGGASVNLAESAAKIGELKSFRFSGNMSLELEGGLPSGSTAEDELGRAILTMLLGSLKDVKVEGAVAAPDEMELKIDLGGQEIGFVQLGDKAWLKFFGAWTAVTAKDLGLEGNLDIGNLGADTLPPEVVNAAKVTREKVNGEDTTRYSFDKAALQSLAEDFTSADDVDSANMDMWITEDGIPVKMSMKMSGKDENGKKVGMQIEFSIKDLNSTNITIKVPI